MSWVSVLALSTMIGGLADRPHLADEGEAVHAAEHQVDQHQVRRVALDELAAPLARSRASHTS